MYCPGPEPPSRGWNIPALLDRVRDSDPPTHWRPRAAAACHLFFGQHKVTQKYAWAGKHAWQAPLVLHFIIVMGEKVFSAKDAIFSQSSLVKAPERMDGMLVLCIFYVYDQAASWSWPWVSSNGCPRKRGGDYSEWFASIWYQNAFSREKNWMPLAGGLYSLRLDLSLLLLIFIVFGVCVFPWSPWILDCVI